MLREQDGTGRTRVGGFVQQFRVFTAGIERYFGALYGSRGVQDFHIRLISDLKNFGEDADAVGREDTGIGIDLYRDSHLDIVVVQPGADPIPLLLLLLLLLARRHLSRFFLQYRRPLFSWRELILGRWGSVGGSHPHRDR